MKKILAFFIVSILIVFGCSAAFAIEEPVVLYSYYGDNMLFKQKDEAVLAGKAPSGTHITCTLLNAKNEQVAYTETVSLDGIFSLSFLAPEGSFEAYSITLTANGTTFAELKNVVFGELWLAGGQSNMQLPLSNSKIGAQMKAENKKGSDALRFLDILHPGYYNGKQNLVPPLPLSDYERPVKWYKGSDDKVYDLSGVGYFFAENLIEELNMPVGLLNANLSGSSIYSWLSREVIEKDSALLADCKKEKRYYSLDNWDEAKVDHRKTMAANFNKTIAPLKNFRLSGMIWYQGEADVTLSYGMYTRAFNALQDSYTDLFSYKDGSLPIVFSQLASHSYGNLNSLQNINMEFSHIQQQRPDSRALTSILDVPLDYLKATQAIHPIRKKEVGDKMAYAAKGLVYNLHDSYTAATVEKSEISGNCIYVTLRDVGDKLIADGNTLNGFSICGNDGVYLSAKAEIVSDNTVKVYSACVENPRSVAYACSQTNNHANLFASRNGEKLLAVSPFVTDMNLNAHFWNNDYWTTCDFPQFWHCHTKGYSGYYDTWKADGAQISFVNSELDTGNALCITSSNNQFIIKPNFLFKENETDTYFQDVDLNWSDYRTLTFKIKVNSKNAIQFDGLKITFSDKLWFMPAIKNTNSTGCRIEADGNVHTVTLDLNRLYPYGNTYAGTQSSNVLSEVLNTEFSFTDINNNGASIYFDDVSFKVEDQSVDSPDKPAFKLDLIERIKAIFVSLRVKIILLFDMIFKK